LFEILLARPARERQTGKAALVRIGETLVFPVRTENIGASVIERRPMKRALFALSLVLAALLVQVARAQGADWEVWIEQGGRRLEFTGEVHLQRQPFTVGFKGPYGYGYLVLSSADKAEIEASSKADQIGKAITATNIAPESQERNNQFLVLNRAGAIAAGQGVAEEWAERDPASGNKRSFLTNVEGPDTLVTAKRQIASIVQMGPGAGQRSETAIEGAPPGQITVMIAGEEASVTTRPPASQVNQGPKIATLVFD